MISAFLQLAEPTTFLLLVIGLVLGLAVGVLPGITTGMLMALALPFTYDMNSTNAVVMLVAMYVGGLSGGLVTATLMRIPGEPSAIMTLLDGYPMARAGRPGRALGLGIAASVVGGVLSWLALVLISPPLARIGLLFGPFENFSIILMAMTLIVTLSEGSFIKGVMAGVLGMLLSMPGMDETSGAMRITFDFPQMNAGFNTLPVIVGLYALSQIVTEVIEPDDNVEHMEASMRGIFISFQDYVTHGWNMLRSSIIGLWFGILPGAGATISSIVAYTTAKNCSRTPELFGTGSEEGIVASEAANNAVSGGTLIPVLTLGIPGGLTDAILLAALVIHNLQPGPMLFVRNPEIVYAVMTTHLVAHILMFILMTLGAVGFAKLARLPKAYILPMTVIFCVVGAFGVNNRIFDVWVMLTFSLLGFVMERLKIPLAPFVVGYVLAPLAEGSLRSGLMASDGSLAPFVQRPISLSFIVVAVGILFYSVYRTVRSGRTAGSKGSA